MELWSYGVFQYLVNLTSSDLVFVKLFEHFLIFFIGQLPHEPPHLMLSLVSVPASDNTLTMEYIAYPTATPIIIYAIIVCIFLSLQVYKSTSLQVNKINC